MDSRSNSDIERSKASSGDLRDIDPAHGAPTELEEAGVEEDADKRKVSSTRNRLAFDWRVDAHVETNVEHGHTLSNRSPEKRATATKRVSSEDEESETSDHLDNTVDSRSEELVLVTLEAECLEDLRGIVVDCICARHLLTDHETNGDESAFAVTGDGKHLLEEILHGCSGNQHALVLELIGNVLDFVLDVRVRER